MRGNSRLLCVLIACVVCDFFSCDFTEKVTLQSRKRVDESSALQSDIQTLTFETVDPLDVRLRALFVEIMVEMRS